MVRRLADCSSGQWNGMKTVSGRMSRVTLAVTSTEPRRVFTATGRRRTGAQDDTEIGWARGFMASVSAHPLVYSNGCPRSSMDRAPGFGPGGCGFESCRGRQNSCPARLPPVTRLPLSTSNFGGGMMSNSPHLAALPAVAAAVLLLLAGCSGGGSPSLLQSRVDASFEVTAAVTYEMVFDLGGTGNPNPVSTTIIQGPWEDASSTPTLAPRPRHTPDPSLDLGDEQYICGRYTGLEPENGCPKARSKPGKTESAIPASHSAILLDEGLAGSAVDFTFSFRETLIESDLELAATSTREIAGSGRTASKSRRPNRSPRRWRYASQKTASFSRRRSPPLKRV